MECCVKRELFQSNVDSVDELEHFIGEHDVSKPKVYEEYLSRKRMRIQ